MKNKLKELGKIISCNLRGLKPGFGYRHKHNHRWKHKNLRQVKTNIDISITLIFVYTYTHVTNEKPGLTVHYIYISSGVFLH